MQQVEKKKRRSRPWLKWLLLALLLITLTAAVLALRRVNQPIDYNSLESPDTYGELLTYEAADVASLSVTLPSGDHWTLLQQNGAVAMADAPNFPLDGTLVESLLEAARVVSYSDILTDKPEDYADNLQAFGLDKPTVVNIAYTDGRTATLRIGNRSDSADAAFYYMLVDGDDRLFALDVTTANTLNMERYLLRAVVQPVIHKARIDDVHIATPTRTLHWMLNGMIQDADAADRWMYDVPPMRYPADGERMTSLRENLSNLRLGAYVTDATPETMAAYGFNEPQMVLTIHQGAGSIGSADGEGVYGLTDWPESTLTLTVGAPKNDNVDYILYEDSIYITSHYSMQTLMNMDAQSTLTRYPVLTSLSNLRTLTITQQGTTHVYTVTLDETYDDAGNVVLDEDGQPVLVNAAAMDGQPINYDVFAAAYNRLLIATVSGSLPDGWQTNETPHTLYTFTTKTGVTHTIALTTFDALHDAVYVDGCCMFYIIKGGLEFAVSSESF